MGTKGEDDNDTPNVEQGGFATEQQGQTRNATRCIEGWKPRVSHQCVCVHKMNCRRWLDGWPSRNEQPSKDREEGCWCQLTSVIQNGVTDVICEPTPLPNGGGPNPVWCSARNNPPAKEGKGGQTRANEGKQSNRSKATNQAMNT